MTQNWNFNFENLSFLNFTYYYYYYYNRFKKKKKKERKMKKKACVILIVCIVHQLYQQQFLNFDIIAREAERARPFHSGPPAIVCIYLSHVGWFWLYLFIFYYYYFKKVILVTWFMVELERLASCACLDGVFFFFFLARYMEMDYGPADAN